MFRSTLALHVYVRALSCCPTSVNCVLGVVLSSSFVEKKLVLRARTDRIRGEKVEGTKEGTEKDKEEGKR